MISGFTEDIRSGVCQYCLSAVLQSAYFIYPTRLSAALFVSSFSVNWIIHKLNISKLAFVVTAKGCDISRYLTSQSPRGVTVVNAAGGYTGKNVNVLMCAMKENEVDLFQKRIIEADPKAFVIYTDASQILGNGFKFYK